MLSASSKRIHELKNKGVKFDIAFTSALNFPDLLKHYDKCALIYYDRDIQDFIIELFSYDNVNHTRCRMSVLNTIKEEIQKEIENHEISGSQHNNI